MEENEKREKYRERIEPLMEEDITRKEGETPMDHLRRMFELKSETHEMAPDILAAICETFSLKSVSDTDFKAGNWIDTKAFIFEVLDLMDIPCADFAPKRS
jgi:hypothetical protein